MTEKRLAPLAHCALAHVQNARTLSLRFLHPVALSTIQSWLLHRKLLISGLRQQIKGTLFGEVMATKAAVLAALLQSAPSDWLLTNATGERYLSELHALCYKAGLTATPASADDATKLNAMCATRPAQRHNLHDPASYECP